MQMLLHKGINSGPIHRSSTSCHCCHLPELLEQKWQVNWPDMVSWVTRSAQCDITQPGWVVNSLPLSNNVVGLGLFAWGATTIDSFSSKLPGLVCCKQCKLPGSSLCYTLQFIWWSSKPLISATQLLTCGICPLCKGAKWRKWDSHHGSS